MDYGVVNNCLCSIEASLRALKFEVSASKAEESPNTDVQQPQPTICPWFIHGSNCANYLTTLKCYEKPCSFDRGKQ